MTLLAFIGVAVVVIATPRPGHRADGAQHARRPRP